MAKEFTKIGGAREHNLKNLTLGISRDKLVVITGLSGSGKPCLATHHFLFRKPCCMRAPCPTPHCPIFLFDLRRTRKMESNMQGPVTPESAAE